MQKSWFIPSYVSENSVLINKACVARVRGQVKVLARGTHWVMNAVLSLDGTVAAGPAP